MELEDGSYAYLTYPGRLMKSVNRRRARCCPQVPKPHVRSSRMYQSAALLRLMTGYWSAGADLSACHEQPDS
jgi:hypothetical protein